MFSPCIVWCRPSSSSPKFSSVILILPLFPNCERNILYTGKKIRNFSDRVFAGQEPAQKIAERRGPVWCVFPPPFPAAPPQ